MGGGSRFIVRHADVSVAAVGTIWRWRGWASTSDDDQLRTHREVDVYVGGSPEPDRVVSMLEALDPGMQHALARLEWAVAATIAGAQEGWRPTLGALRSARRGTFKPRALPSSRPRAASQRSQRPSQPVRLNRLLVDVTHVWEGATVRLAITRQRVDLQVRGGQLQVGDLPTPIQKALRYGGAATGQAAGIQLDAAARILAGRVPSWELAQAVREEFEQRSAQLAM